YLCQLLFLLFFNDTATTPIYTLSLHDALPIFDLCEVESTRPTLQAREVQEVLHEVAEPLGLGECGAERLLARRGDPVDEVLQDGDRKSTRLNSSHVKISYAVFCLKKKKKTKQM